MHCSPCFLYLTVHLFSLKQTHLFSALFTLLFVPKGAFVFFTTKSFIQCIVHLAFLSKGAFVFFTTKSFIQCIVHLAFCTQGCICLLYNTVIYSVHCSPCFLYIRVHLFSLQQTHLFSALLILLFVSKSAFVFLHLFSLQQSHLFSALFTLLFVSKGAFLFYTTKSFIQCIARLAFLDMHTYFKIYFIYKRYKMIGSGKRTLQPIVSA